MVAIAVVDNALEDWCWLSELLVLGAAGVEGVVLLHCLMAEVWRWWCGNTWRLREGSGVLTEAKRLLAVAVVCKDGNNAL